MLFAMGQYQAKSPQYRDDGAACFVRKSSASCVTVRPLVIDGLLWCRW